MNSNYDNGTKMKESLFIDKLIEELCYLRKSHDLLKKVYIEVGAYGHAEIEKTTVFEINDHFGFDDNE